MNIDNVYRRTSCGGAKMFLLVCIFIGSTMFTLDSNAQVRSLGLQEMIQSAEVIFVGTVLEVRGRLDEREDIVTYTTFRVDQPVRGALGGRTTIKQFGGESEGGTMHLAHMRYFNEGEQVVVMLYPPSKLGFTSPIGMGQGVWEVTDDGMVKGVTSTLLQGLGTLPASQGVNPNSSNEVPLSGFIGLIQELSRGGE